MMLNIFPYVYWPSVCPPWRSVYSGLLFIFLVGFVFLVLSNISSVYIFIICIIGKIVLPFSGSLFIFLMVSFAVLKILVWCSPIYLFVFFVSLACEIHQQKHCYEMSEILLLIFSSRIFTVLQFIFKSLIHFVFILFFFM